MTEQFANNASSTLDGAIDDVTTTLVVTDASSFPSDPEFRLLIGVNPLNAELVLVTGVAGNTFTVLRGQEGTTAASWGDDTTVTHILTSGAIEQIRTQWVTDNNTISTDKIVKIGDTPFNIQRFGYVSDAMQSFVVPDDVTELLVKIWGPGGGSGNYSGSGGGGPGGFSTGLLTVTPGETLYLAVGSGGDRPISATGNGGLGGWPGGGFGARGDASGGGGGGLSGIFSTNTLTQGDALIIAGGGGGSTGFGNFGAGGGGGDTGGSGAGTSGKGGTQIAGGLNGNGTASPAYTAGSALQGGTAFTDNTTSQGNDAGGGGSGYFGGGAGQGDGRAGGGGSGYLHPSRIVNGITIAGTNAASGSVANLPPSTNDPYYISGIGVGGAASGAGNDGGDGYIVLVYGGQSTITPDDITLANNFKISSSALDVDLSSDGYIKLKSATLLHNQIGTDIFTLASATQGVRLDVNSTTIGRLYQTGAWVIGDATNNDTAAEAQAGLTGPLITLSSSTGNFTTITNQALIFNQSGALNLQGNTEVRFNTGSALRGYFDTNGVLRLGPSANSNASIFGGGSPFANVDFLYMHSAAGSAWETIVSGGLATRAAIQILNSGSGGSATSGVSLFAAGSSHGTAAYAGNGVIEQSGSATSGLVFTKMLGNNTGLASTGAIWQSGAWAIGRATNNDTSSEAQAGLTGPLINISAITGGTLTSTANQTLLYNSAGINTIQGHVGVRQIVGTTTILDTTSTGTVITGNLTATSKFVVGTSGPTITQGTGVPASSEVDGSIFLRTDGTPTAALYTRQSGAWAPIRIGDGFQHLRILSGVASNIGAGANSFIRVGSIRVNTTDYASATVTFEAVFEATADQTAEVRLYNVTDGGVVGSSTLSTAANTATYSSASITLASGDKIYEAQIRIINGSPGPTDGVICSSVNIKIR